MDKLAGLRPDNMNDFWDEWLRIVPPPPWGPGHCRTIEDIWYEHGDSISCFTIPGDMDGDNRGPNIADLVNYMVKNGSAVPCDYVGDANCDGTYPDMADLVYLVNFMFRQPAPALQACT